MNLDVEKKEVSVVRFFSTLLHLSLFCLHLLVKTNMCLFSLNHDHTLFGRLNLRRSGIKKTINSGFLRPVSSSTFGGMLHLDYLAAHRSDPDHFSQSIRGRYSFSNCYDSVSPLLCH